VLGVLLRVALRAAALLHEHLLERLGGEQPLLAADVGLGRIAREVALAIALRGAAIVAGLLVHLGGDRQVARGDVGLGGELPLLVLRVDRARGVRLAALRVELGRLEEAVLVVADLGGAHVQAGADEVARGVVEQADRHAQLARLGGVLLRDPRRLGARLLLAADLVARRRGMAASESSSAADIRPPPGRSAPPTATIPSGASTKRQPPVSQPIT
jgi:hypothetical protein